MLSTMHHWLAIIVGLCFLLAAVQAILLFCQEGRLRRHSQRLFKHVYPALATLEKLMFFWVWVGFVFLSLIIGFSLWSLQGSETEWLWDKFIFSLIAWILFAALLFLRFRLGWRGQAAAIGTLGGILLLLIVYALTH